MKIKAGFVKREVMDKTVIVPTGEAGKTIKGMIKLNATASFIWDCVAEGMDLPAIADKMVATYGIDKETALKDAETIVSQMKQAGVFEE